MVTLLRLNLLKSKLQLQDLRWNGAERAERLAVEDFLPRDTSVPPSLCFQQVSVLARRGSPSEVGHVWPVLFNIPLTGG